MILVTGTKRSGTSLWMQILIAAGLPHIGEAFPGIWEESIRDANPRGFYESPFRRGVFWATNPDPKTGHFLFPQQVRGHVVKVFIPGLVRTDYGYIDRVVATMRNWREYPSSVQRLYAMEDEYYARKREEREARGESVDDLKVHRSPLPPAIEWWFENYDLIRDVSIRKYPINLMTFDRLLDDPERVIGAVLKWLGTGDLDKAVAEVDTSARTQKARPEQVEGVDAEAAEVFDTLYDVIHNEKALSKGLLEKLNETHKRLEEQFKPTPTRKRDPVPE